MVHFIFYLLLVFFFFFKQKTAYEMLRSLVGSEMCIRDRCVARPWTGHMARSGGDGGQNDMDIGLLVLRLAVGLTMAAHGGQKLFGWFGGYGIAGTGGFLESLGFRPGKVHAGLAGTAELLGGLLIALGLLTPVGAALVIAVMVVAIG